MRLFHTTEFTLTEFNAEQVPRYAILSHRWRQDELTFQDVETGSFFKKKGFWKIKNACRVARRCGCDWLWADTCCIDKRNAVELNEAINAMYAWYKQADLCIAYLFDHTHRLDGFLSSSWFTRCWTLQELIAPRDVDFYDSNWAFIGTKSDRCVELATITGIPEHILKGDDPRQCSVAQRMSWAAKRRATRIEDQAYSLLGLFNLSMPTLYGSGSQAFQSLQEKLLQKHDQSILAWDRSAKGASREYTGLLAESPADFASCRSTKATDSPIGSIMLVGDGVELNVDTIPFSLGAYLCVLDCTSNAADRCDAILLQQLDAPQQYARVLRDSDSIITVSKRRLKHDTACKRRKLYVHHDLRHAPAKLVHGIRIREISLLDQYGSSHDKIRILSRLDGCVNTNDSGCMVQLPREERGTAGIIYFPRDQPNFKYWPVRWIKLGFDDDFCPVLRLGFDGRTTDDLSWATKHPPARGTKEYKHIWDDHWVYQRLQRMTKVRPATQNSSATEREYTAGEYFNHRRFEQHTAHSSSLRLYSHYLGLEIKLRLKDCPSKGLPQPLSVPGPGPWKVWTLEIAESRNFRSETHRQDAMYAMLTAAVGALYVRTKVQRRLNEKKKEEEQT